MGFALWIEGDVARAEGAHEYRPMGVAVVAVTSQFVTRDFFPAARVRSRAGPGFAGFFGSLIELNAHLARRRTGRVDRAPMPRGALPYF